MDTTNPQTFNEISSKQFTQLQSIPNSTLKYLLFVLFSFFCIGRQLSSFFFFCFKRQLFIFFIFYFFCQSRLTQGGRRKRRREKERQGKVPNQRLTERKKLKKKSRIQEDNSRTKTKSLNN